MAHKGHFFPVAFRRDFNLNVQTNNDGFANRYLVTINDIDNNCIDPINGVVFECGPATLFNPPTMIWLSAKRVVGFNAYQLEMRATLVGLPQLYNWKMTLSAPNLPDTVATWRPQADNGQPFWNTDGTQEVTYANPAFWSAFPRDLQDSDVQPKDWSFGPPH